MKTELEFNGEPKQTKISKATALNKTQNCSKKNKSEKSNNTKKTTNTQLSLISSNLPDTKTAEEIQEIAKNSNITYKKLQHTDGHIDKAGGNLSYVNFSGKNLEEAILYDANLYKANLQRANLKKANLKGVDLRGADLRGANLTGADLSGAKLTGALLDGANLGNANLTGADLKGNQNLREVNLLNANLTNADLSETNLSNSIFGCEEEGDVKTITKGTRFNNANLSGADFSFVNLQEANIDGITIDENTDLRMAPLPAMEIAKIKGLNSLDYLTFSENTSFDNIDAKDINSIIVTSLIDIDLSGMKNFRAIKSLEETYISKESTVFPWNAIEDKKVAKALRKQTGEKAKGYTISDLEKLADNKQASKGIKKLIKKELEFIYNLVLPHGYNDDELYGYIN